MKGNFQRLHQSAIEIARRFHRAEYDLIDVLQEIDRHKVFVRLGFGSLFDYATKALNLSEANASNFITGARKSVSVPQLKEAIRKGDLTVSKARKITPVLTENNAEEWLKLAKELPKPKLEKEIAKFNPKLAVAERARYVSGERIELRIGVSEVLMERLKRAQDLLSQKHKKAMNYEETLSHALEILLSKSDPVKKANRNERAKNSKKADDAIASVPGTRRLTAQQKHQVFFRDRGRCTHVDKTGSRCEAKRWIEIHHQVPLSRGGSNDTENLRTLCHAHHKYAHLTF